MKRYLFAFFAIVILTEVRAQIVDVVRSRKDDYDKLHSSPFALLPHRETFILPYVHNWRTHEDLYAGAKELDPDSRNGDFYKSSEAEFQVSFAIPLIRELNDRDWDVMVAYTHHAWWQVYNSEWSRPFRETNYMPELFSRYIYSTPKKIFGLNLFALDVGYIHQSNGQIQLLSRSWDRIFVRTMFKHQEFSVLLTGWYRIRERRDQDDNPGIYNFRGLGDLEVYKKFNKHTLHFKMPILAHHDSYDFKYSYPIQEGLRWYLSYQTGFGHSMIEYDKRVQRLGAGIVLDNFFL